jgi:hypothetical protein
LRRQLERFRGGRGLARITAAFRAGDAGGSSALDTFELAHAVAHLLGRPPPSHAVAAMVAHASGGAASGGNAVANNALSLLQFVHLVHTFNWEAAMADSTSPPQANA